MKIGRRLTAFALTVLALAPTMGIAQIERLSPTRQERELSALAAQLRAGLPQGPMREHLARARKNASKKRDAAVLAERVYCDVSNALPSAPFVHYAVPPMSDVQRLEDVYPIDGEASEPVRICAAKDEFEPGSFLVYPLADLGKVTFTLTPFKTDDGKVFPADKLDLKVVKVWYQNKNGWYSYFGDTDFKLCPELLLHDEQGQLRARHRPRRQGPRNLDQPAARDGQARSRKGRHQLPPDGAELQGRGDPPARASGGGALP